LDLAKYRAIFLEEASEHLAEISHALLKLEKELDSSDAIDTIFRMAHSIKGMAVSLEYDSITEIAHALEDRMQAVRSAGRVQGEDDLPRLFRGLEGLERMLKVVRETGEPPPPDPDLAAELAQLSTSIPATRSGTTAGLKKKAQSPQPPQP
jgi:two-component system chemotaxis sensor kinase CheA